MERELANKNYDAAYRHFCAREPSPAAAGAHKPSYFIYAAQAFREAGAPSTMCYRIVSNVLETSLANAQTCRVVGYFLVSVGELDQAVTLFEMVLEIASEEPQSHTDIAFAKFFRLRQRLEKGLFSAEGEGEGARAGGPDRDAPHEGAHHHHMGVAFSRD